VIGEVGFDVLFRDVVGHEWAVGEGEVREGHCDCWDVCPVLVLVRILGGGQQNGSREGRVDRSLSKPFLLVRGRNLREIIWYRKRGIQLWW
jgi:hypothetical protein